MIESPQTAGCACPYNSIPILGKAVNGSSVDRIIGHSSLIQETEASERVADPEPTRRGCEQGSHLGREKLIAKGELNGSNRVPSKRNNPFCPPSHRNPSLVCAKHATSAGAPSLKVQESWTTCRFADAGVFPNDDGHQKQVTIIKTTSQHSCEAVTRIECAERSQSPTGTKDLVRWCVLLTALTFYP